VPTTVPIEFAKTRSVVPPSFRLICQHLPSNLRAFPRSRLLCGNGYRVDFEHRGHLGVAELSRHPATIPQPPGRR
jgi:hypothetical protein